MAKSKTVLYAAGVTCLGFICFGLASAAIGIPIWGYYDSPAGYDLDRGYFGPFKVCKQLSYNREKCGTTVSKFHLSSAVYISGLLAVLSSAALGMFSLLSVIQIAMASSMEKVVIPYTVAVLLKMIMASIGCLLAIVATVMFALQIDDRENNGFRISRGVSFYLQIVVVILTIALFAVSLYDVIYSRRPGGDPTMIVANASSSSATTYNNPGYKEPRSRNGVSVTDASGKPYSGIRNGGSVASMSTTLTSVSNGSTVESLSRSPLRSSLKKPRPRPDNTLGIQNPGFSGLGHSPTMNRQVSVKKVRIQTHSTEV